MISDTPEERAYQRGYWEGRRDAFRENGAELIKLIERIQQLQEPQPIVLNVTQEQAADTVAAIKKAQEAKEQGKE